MPHVHDRSQTLLGLHGLQGETMADLLALAHSKEARQKRFSGPSPPPSLPLFARSAGCPPGGLAASTLRKRGREGGGEASSLCHRTLQWVQGSKLRLSWWSQRWWPARSIRSTRGLVAMTSAQHAEGRQFEPGRVYYCQSERLASAKAPHIAEQPYSSGKQHRHLMRQSQKYDFESLLGGFYLNTSASSASAASWPAQAIRSTCGLVAMTSAPHAEGRQFEPGQVYYCQSPLLAWSWWGEACSSSLVLPTWSSARLHHRPS